MVLNVLRSKKLVATEDKVHLLVKQLKLLGRIVNGQGISVDPALVQDVRSFPAPTSVKKVREFIGLVGSYRNFIKDFNLVAESIIRLTRKDIAFNWGAEQKIAFDKLVSLI